jgi:DtxR family transcriptional regulator, Mn-dependent transcriptional regulator
LEDHKDHALEELLEALYKAREDGQSQVSPEKLPIPSVPSKNEISSFISRGLIDIKNGQIALAPDGIVVAETLVRRHRLAERLFSEILELDEGGLDSTSCSFEHVLDPAVTEQICTMLGHPPTCPHGKRIPPGECCKNSRTEITPLVMALKELPVGSSAKIVFITTPYHQRLNRLINLGVVPGGKIFLQQKKPSYLLRLGMTEVAIDEEIASEIYVRKT